MLKNVAIYALAVSSVLFGGVEDHGNQGAGRDAAPALPATRQSA